MLRRIKTEQFNQEIMDKIVNQCVEELRCFQREYRKTKTTIGKKSLVDQMRRSFFEYEKWFKGHRLYFHAGNSGDGQY